MTNLYNRRYLHEVASTIFSISKREEHPMSLIMIDIDNFKSINDTYGHIAGDKVIQKLALLLQDSVRESDIVSRFGGEEFLIILPNTDISGAKIIASKIRELVENSSITIDEKRTISFTISLGVTGLKMSDSSIESILKRVDMALYEAKEKGKNRTIVYKDDFYS